MDEYKRLQEIVTELKAQAAKVTERIEAMMDSAQDPVVAQWRRIFESRDVQTFETTDLLIRKAHDRKLIGNPPTSPDKPTICDELIWETLLANVRDDLVIVTRDKGFIDHQSILKIEFRQKTNRQLVLVTRSINEALRKVGETPPPKLVEEEQVVEKALSEADESRDELRTRKHHLRRLLEELRAAGLTSRPRIRE